MRKFLNWVRFRTDGLVLSGARAGALLLVVATGILVLLCGLVLTVADIEAEQGTEVSFLEATWLSLLRTLDPGTMGGDNGWIFRLTSLVATLAGVFILSVFIGVITTGLDSRISELRRGRGAVQLRDHTLILGWSSATESLIEELGEANRSRHRPSVVILSESDPADVRDRLAEVIRRHSHQRVFVRAGNPSNLANLLSVSAESARAIVALHGHIDKADAENVRNTLAVVNELPNFKGAIVTQVTDRSLADALREATMGRATVISKKEVMTKVASQVCKTTGLARIYEDLLDFDGSEIYIKHEPRLEGKTFATAALSYENSIPIGVLTGNGSVELCPSWGRVLRESDQIIGIAEDDSTFVLVETLHEAPTIENRPPLEAEPRRILVIGWSEIASGLVENLLNSLPQGSSITVSAPNFEIDKWSSAFSNVRHLLEDIDRMSGLSRLVNGDQYDNIVLLCSRDRSIVEDDGINLMRLLELRQLLDDPNCRSAGANVVTELRDVSDVEIAGASGDDFVVSDRISSLLMAQLAEDPLLETVLDEILNVDGVEIITIPASRLSDQAQETFSSIRKSGMPYGAVIGTVAPGRGGLLNPSGDLLVDIAGGDAVVVMRRVAEQTAS